MTNTRDFPDSTKLAATKRNLRKYAGQLTCENCQKKITPEVVHFDHIEPWINGGRSILENCQILCNVCNEKKSDKLQEDFEIEEKAGNVIATTNSLSSKYELPSIDKPKGLIPKEIVIKMIIEYCRVHTNITYKDFLRRNITPPLPSIHHITTYWGTVTIMKQQLGLNPRTFWTKANCTDALKKWIDQHTNIIMKDLGSKNRLPSQTVIRKYFGSLSNLKKELRLINKPVWKNLEDVQESIEAYIKKKGVREITTKELISQNGLPGYPVINRLFGSMAEFQRRNNLIVTQSYPTKKTIEEKLLKAFGSNKRIFNNKKQLFSTLVTSGQTLKTIYGDFDKFVAETNIQIEKHKNQGWTKREIEKVTWQFIQINGVTIPKGSELTKLSLPSAHTYSRYWKNYRVAFKYIINKNL